MSIDDAERSPQNIREQYREAGSPEEWVRREVGRFFHPDTDEVDLLSDLGDEGLSRDGESFDRFMQSGFQPDAVIALEIEIVSEDANRLSSFSLIPTPAGLLWLCSQLCDVGDSVVVRHRFAAQKVVEIGAQWPFGMNEAVAMTSPHADQLVDGEGGLLSAEGLVAANVSSREIDHEHWHDGPSPLRQVGWALGVLSGALVVGALAWRYMARAD